MKVILRPFILTKSNVQAGYLCIANHVVMWMPECTSCFQPMTTMGKVLRESRAQGREGAETWLRVLESGIKGDSKVRACRVRLCKECYKEDSNG